MLRQVAPHIAVHLRLQRLLWLVLSKVENSQVLLSLCLGQSVIPENCKEKEMVHQDRFPHSCI